jgi:hypothetical protein
MMNIVVTGSEVSVVGGEISRAEGKQVIVWFAAILEMYCTIQLQVGRNTYLSMIRKYMTTTPI